MVARLFRSEPSAIIDGMRYRRAVEKLRALGEACTSSTRLPLDEPFLREAYVFGEVLAGADPVESVEVALVLNLPSPDVPWESQPRGTAWLVDHLRLDKGGYRYWWRSREGPVANHVIREPVRFWSATDGPDETVLQALAERRFDFLSRQTEPESIRGAAELASALENLRAVCGSYWEREWRREHRGSGRYPEDTLWEAVHGYLDLLDAEKDGG
jgi:hypothetical protein